MVKSLGNKWKELLFSFSGFGPNFLMVVMGAYFTDAINPAALGNDSFQAISNTCLILPALFPILWMIAKAFDGIIDIPFAALTDNMSTKWGKRRPAIAACFIPMIISYVMCCAGIQLAEIISLLIPFGLLSGHWCSFQAIPCVLLRFTEVLLPCVPMKHSE